jgi:dienelactone hydrolase
MPIQRFLTPASGVAKLLQARPALHFAGKTRQQWQVWRRRFRAALLQRMGDVPERLPLKSQRVERVAKNGYTRETILFNPDAFSTISAYVLVPTNIRAGECRPAILCAHGHGSGKSSQVDRSDGNYNQIAVKLCREGFIVMAPDWRSFGQRSDSAKYIEHWKDEHGRDGCDLSNLLYGYFGYQMLTLNVCDAQRCIDYLQQRSDVDANRIGCAGLSFGGTMTTFATAVDRRIKAAVISGYLSTISDALGDRGRGNTCGSQFLFGLRTIGEISDVAGLIAPRPCLVQIGSQDTCFIERDALAAFNHLRRIYRASGAGPNLELDHFDGGHEMNVTTAVEFLRRRLMDSAQQAQRSH